MEQHHIIQPGQSLVVSFGWRNPHGTPYNLRGCHAILSVKTPDGEYRDDSRWPNTFIRLGGAMGTIGITIPKGILTGGPEELPQAPDLALQRFATMPWTLDVYKKEEHWQVATGYFHAVRFVPSQQVPALQPPQPVVAKAKAAPRPKVAEKVSLRSDRSLLEPKPGEERVRADSSGHIRPV